MSLRHRIRRSLARVWSLGAATRNDRIVYYHSVDPDAPRSHRPAQFAEQIAWLRAEGYRTVFPWDLLVRRQPGEPPRVAITFDDGYRDNLLHAAPLLEAQGMVATFFVVAGLVGDATPRRSDEGFRLYPGRDMLTAGDCRALVERGHALGSHTWSHQQAGPLEAGQPGAFAGELERSVRRLEEAGGARVRAFAYPNGQRGAFSAQTHALLRGSGLSCAMTTLWAPLSPDRAGADPWSLPRCEMAASDGLDDFVAKMSGAHDYLYAVHRLRRGARAWTTPTATTP